MKNLALAVIMFVILVLAATTQQPHCLDQGQPIDCQLIAGK